MALKGKRPPPLSKQKMRPTITHLDQRLTTEDHRRKKLNSSPYRQSTIKFKIQKKLGDDKHDYIDSAYLSPSSHSSEAEDTKDMRQSPYQRKMKEICKNFKIAHQGLEKPLGLFLDYYQNTTHLYAFTEDTESVSLCVTFVWFACVMTKTSCQASLSDFILMSNVMSPAEFFRKARTIAHVLENPFLMGFLARIQAVQENCHENSENLIKLLKLIYHKYHITSMTYERVQEIWILYLFFHESVFEDYLNEKDKDTPGNQLKWRELFILTWTVYSKLQAGLPQSISSEEILRDFVGTWITEKEKVDFITNEYKQLVNETLSCLSHGVHSSSEQLEMELQQRYSRSITLFDGRYYLPIIKAKFEMTKVPMYLEYLQVLFTKASDLLILDKLIVSNLSLLPQLVENKRLQLIDKEYKQLIEGLFWDDWKKNHARSKIKNWIGNKLFHKSLLFIITVITSPSETFDENWIGEIKDCLEIHYFNAAVLIEVVALQYQKLKCKRDAMVSKSLEWLLFRKLLWKDGSYLYSKLQLNSAPMFAISNRALKTFKAPGVDDADKSKEGDEFQLELFYRKLFRLSSQKLTVLCERLFISPSIKIKIWNVLATLLSNEEKYELTKSRQLDILIIATILGTTKQCRMNLSFKEIVAAYFNHTDTTKEEQERILKAVPIDSHDKKEPFIVGTIVDYYNNDYLPVAKPIIERTCDEEANETIHPLLIAKGKQWNKGKFIEGGGEEIEGGGIDVVWPHPRVRLSGYYMIKDGVALYSPLHWNTPQSMISNGEDHHQQDTSTQYRRTVDPDHSYRLALSDLIQLSSESPLLPSV